MNVTSLEGLVSPALRGDLSNRTVGCCRDCTGVRSTISLYDVMPSALRIDSLERFVNASFWQFESGQVREMLEHGLQRLLVETSVSNVLRHLQHVIRPASQRAICCSRCRCVSPSVHRTAAGLQFRPLAIAIRLSTLSRLCATVHRRFWL